VIRCVGKCLLGDDYWRDRDCFDDLQGGQSLAAKNNFELAHNLKKEKGLRDEYLRKPLIFLVPEIGIEPTTYALRMRRSTN
jgi:hypothetical protein